MMVVVAAIIHSVFHVPFRGNSLIMGAAACLLIIGYLAMGALFTPFTPNLAARLERHRNLLLSSVAIWRVDIRDAATEMSGG